jgi:hypothetical protein
MKDRWHPPLQRVVRVEFAEGLRKRQHVLHLACGHTVRRRPAIPIPAAVRCKACQ